MTILPLPLSLTGEFSADVSLSPSALWNEVRIGLLRHPQLESIFQQHFFRLEPHDELSWTWETNGNSFCFRLRVNVAAQCCSHWLDTFAFHLEQRSRWTFAGARSQFHLQFPDFTRFRVFRLSRRKSHPKICNHSDLLSTYFLCWVNS